MRWMAGLAALALLSTSCSDEPRPDVATPTDTTTTTTTSTVPWAAPLATPWHEQVPFDPLGQDPADCFNVVDTGPTDPESGDTEPATIFGENWMISYDVPTLIDGVDVDERRRPGRGDPEPLGRLHAESSRHHASGNRPHAQVAGRSLGRRVRGDSVRRR